ncbi:MAG: hypothetical protein Rpha_1294 [Candidatus Ruthia sp. Apha_13_S6]|nr:hypothetical protein [Candidatus Ruthia sp. Apha_13_S6]
MAFTMETILALGEFFFTTERLCFNADCEIEAMARMDG